MILFECVQFHYKLHTKGKFHHIVSKITNNIRIFDAGVKTKLVICEKS